MKGNVLGISIGYKSLKLDAQFITYTNFKLVKDIPAKKVNVLSIVVLILPVFKILKLEKKIRNYFFWEYHCIFPKVLGTCSTIKSKNIKTTLKHSLPDYVPLTFKVKKKRSYTSVKERGWGMCRWKSSYRSKNIANVYRFSKESSNLLKC